MRSNPNKHAKCRKVDSSHAGLSDREATSDPFGPCIRLRIHQCLERCRLATEPTPRSTRVSEIGVELFDKRSNDRSHGLAFIAVAGKFGLTDTTLPVRAVARSKDVARGIDFIPAFQHVGVFRHHLDQFFQQVRKRHQLPATEVHQPLAHAIALRPASGSRRQGNDHRCASAGSSA